MKKFYLKMLVLLVISGCSSGPVTKDQATTEIKPDTVVARIDNLSARPDWVKESDIFKVENSTVFFLGKHTVPSDSNLQQAFRAAELNAKANLAKAVESKFATVFQNAEEGYNLDANQARFMAIEASKEMQVGNIRVSKRYWEKYKTITDSGQTKSMTDVFTLVEMPEADFKAAILDASRTRQGKNGLSADFSQKVDQQWDEFLGVDRNPAQQ